MPKRKLSDVTDTAPAQTQNQNLKLQTTRLKQKFDFGVTTLSRALKTARGFERQKLGRRQKTAKGAENANADTARRIEGEIAVLKTLDPTITAQKYLFKQLAKTKRIAEALIFYRFKQSKQIPLEGPKSTEEANVTARLFKSNPVKNVLPGIMDDLRGLFGLEEARGKKEGAGKGGSGKVVDDRAAAGGGGSVERRGQLDVSGDESEDEGRDVDMDDAESGEEDYSHFDVRLASGSENENDGDGALSDDDQPAKSKAHLPRSDMSISISPSPSRSPSPSQSPPQKKAKPQGKATTTPATSTTFLPSLMMGGYWSGSESEAEEVEEAPRRKNRMGQQARRALWEKKYGAAANHIKNQKKKGGKNNRDSGWDPRKGATGDGDSARRRFGTGSNAMAMTAERRPEKITKDSKKAQDDKPLHPSWEAAKKAKEQKATASFQGKKVVFD